MSERGQQGDHGQDGRQGETGVPGPVGERGQQGKDGLTGLSGKDVFTKGQSIALFLAILFAFVLLVFRTEANADRIDRLEERIRVLEGTSQR